MTSKDILNIFKKTGGYITNSHIVLTSGRHSDAYFNKDAIYPHTQQISLICQEIAKKFKDRNIDVVVAPAMGGIILSQWVAYHLSKLTRKEILAIYTEKTTDKNQILTRGYNALVKGKKVLVVEDVTATGASVMKVINSIRQVQGKVIAVSVLVNREPNVITSDTLTAPFYPLLEFKVKSWDEKDCPLCQKGIPINTIVGKGKEYLAKKLHIKSPGNKKE